MHTYDATWLILYASAWARFNEDDTGGRSLARGLRKISSGDPMQIRASSWPSVVSAFEDGATLDVEGGSGELDYDPDTEETAAPIEVWGIVGDPGNYEFSHIETIG